MTEAQINSVAELLSATNSAELGDLEAAVDDFVELDGRIEIGTQGVTLVVGPGYMQDLEYPFTQAEFWQVLDALDDRCWEQDDEDEGLPG